LIDGSIGDVLAVINSAERFTDEETEIFVLSKKTIFLAFFKKENFSAM
jgi:hypothetical protein